MNRRNLVKAAITLPIATALSACRREPESSKGTLKVILNGPFGVVLHSDKDYRITAYVPSDPAQEHKLYFRGPSEPAGQDTRTERNPTYSFELPHEGLNIGRGRPRIDQGFDDFNFPHIGKWEFPKETFVAIDLPRPDYITFTPPAEPVVFGRPTLQPLDHILEYRMSEPDEVRVKSRDKTYKPLACSEVLSQYQDYWTRMDQKQQGNSGNAEASQRKNMEEMLKSCQSSDRCLLFGVGLDPDRSPMNLEEHGLDFFNRVLLPSLFPRLRRTLQKANFCAQPTGDAAPSPGIRPAALMYGRFEPRLLQISAILDCHRGGAMGTTP